MSISKSAFFHEMVMFVLILENNRRIFTKNYLVISFANWLIFVNEKLSHKHIIANKATHTSWMIKILASFNAIAFVGLFTFHTNFGDFGITFVTIRFITSLKKFPINFPSATTAFKALFVVDFAEGCAAFHANGLFADTTFS